MFKTTIYKSSLVLVFGLCLSASLSLSAKQTYSLPGGEVLSDPTAPYGEKRKAAAKTKRRMPNFSLNYIMSAGDNRRAMINGKKVYEGDFVSGATVRRISSESVSLVYDGREVVLHLNKIKQIRK